MNGRHDKHARSSALCKSDAWLIVLLAISSGVTVYQSGVIHGREEREKELQDTSPPEDRGDVFHPGD